MNCDELMEEKTISSKTIYEGRVVGLEVLEVEIEEGRRGIREVVRHRGAVAVLGMLPDGRFVFVRQFRKPVEREVLEIVAGCLEDGEHPETCAIREVKEETGYDVASITKLGTLWPSPGYSDELLHLFCAELEPGDGHNCPDEDERIEVICLTENEVDGMISRGEIRDGKTIAAWFLKKEATKTQRHKR